MSRQCPLPCVGGKAATSGDGGEKVASLRPATVMHYIRTTGMMSTSLSLCDLISAMATALHFCHPKKKKKKQAHHEAVPAVVSVQAVELTVSVLDKT